MVQMRPSCIFLNWFAVKLQMFYSGCSKDSNIFSFADFSLIIIFDVKISKFNFYPLYPKGLKIQIMKRNIFLTLSLTAALLFALPTFAQMANKLSPIRPKTCHEVLQNTPIMGIREGVTYLF